MGSPFTPNAVPAPVLQRRWLESRYHVRTAHEIFKVRLPKRKIPPTQYRRRILSGETDGKMIGCVARRYVLSGQSLTESGGYHGENHHFFSRIWNKRYHGSVGASIWFCDFYCDKAIEVRLIIANWFFNVSETSLVCISRIGDSVHNNISFCVNAGVIVSAGYIQ